MMIDYHPTFQQIAFADTETGECGERRLNHSDGKAEKFYRAAKSRSLLASGNRISCALLAARESSIKTPKSVSLAGTFNCISLFSPVAS
jgi:hypothetical protein